MRAFIFISKTLAAAWALFLSSLLLSPLAHGEDLNSTGISSSAADQPESPDYSETPYTRFGEFNEEKDEAEATAFFQNGRFFGVSVGSGIHGVTGDRGIIWQGGFPMLDFRLHVWLTLGLAVQLQIAYAPYSYQDSSTRVDVSLYRMGADLKYYFDLANLSSALTFANPYIFAGGGVFTKNQANISNTAQQDSENAPGLSFGAGLEFPIKDRKVYANLEMGFHAVTFSDRFSTRFRSQGAASQKGLFYSTAVSLLFTW